MAFRDELENLGVNVTEGVDRCMGDEGFYAEMLGIFVDTLNESRVSLEDFDTDDVEGLAGRVHTMKGMTGNLSLIPLYDGYMKALGLLRENKVQEARNEMEKLLPIQSKIIECIENNRK